LLPYNFDDISVIITGSVQESQFVDVATLSIDMISGGFFGVFSVHGH
jgi:hypothetical protein